MPPGPRSLSKIVRVPTVGERMFGTPAPSDEPCAGQPVYGADGLELARVSGPGVKHFFPFGTSHGVIVYWRCAVASTRTARRVMWLRLGSLTFETYDPLLKIGTKNATTVWIAHEREPGGGFRVLAPPPWSAPKPAPESAADSPALSPPFQDQCSVG